jgi:ABC-type phosphate transport system substrate-binding protein
MLNRNTILTCALAVLAVTGGSASAEDCVVIVNPSNPTTSMRKADVSRLFLKQTAKWTNGAKVVPVDLPTKSSTRADFTRTVHGRTIEAVQAYWNQKMFSGADVPPEQKPSERDVVEFVRVTPGAVGYVSAAAVGKQVKVLRVLD